MSWPTPTDRCFDCGNKLPPQMAYKCHRCPMCKHKARHGFIPLTPEEVRVQPLVPCPGLCQHCLDEPPYERPIFVRSKGKAYWLCADCRLFVGRTGELPVIDYEIVHADGFEWHDGDGED